MRRRTFVRLILTLARAAVGVAVAVCLCPEHAVAGNLSYVLCTIDVETRTATGNDLSRDIWGILPGETERHGIERMMDILEQHNVKGTFFVNVYDTPKCGEEELARVCRTIRGRGHEVGLHTHPDGAAHNRSIQDEDLTGQEAELKRGMDALRKWGLSDVIAHRAGSYLANLDTVRACAQAGLFMEFSCNVAAPGSGLTHAGLTQNAPVVRDGVLCVPVTAYAQGEVGSWQSMRFLDIESSSPDEIRQVVSELKSHDVRTAVIMMHSFSFSRFGKPNHRAEKAMDDLLAGFAKDPDVRVVSARQLYDIWRADPQALAGGDFVPTTGWWMTYCRAWQRLDEGWKNVVVATGPPAALVLAGGIGGVAWRRRRRKAQVAA